MMSTKKRSRAALSIAMIGGAAFTYVYFVFLADLVAGFAGNLISIGLVPLACAALTALLVFACTSMGYASSDLIGPAAFFAGLGSALTICWVLFAMSMPH